MAKDSLYIVNMKEVIGDFEKYKDAVDNGGREVLQQSGVMLQRLQVKILEQKVKKRTGNLQSSIPVPKATKYSVAVGPDTKKAEYAGYIEHGRPPFTIRPKNGKYLKFKVNGQWVSVTQVQHPGFRGYWYVRSSFNFVKPKFIAAMKRLIEQPPK